MATTRLCIVLKSQRKPARRASKNTGDAALSAALDVLERIQEKRGRRLLAIIDRRFIDRTVAYEVTNLLRRMGDVGGLDILLDSGGGDLDAAYKTLKVMHVHAKDTAVIVPFYAKSAATLIALGGDRLILCKGGELGPVDPQVQDIITGVFVPANSIKETVDFLEGLSDNVVKVSLTEKIPTLMVGAYRAAAKASKQYLEEVISARNVTNKKALVEMFTEKFFSHGYPMDAALLRKNKIEVSEIDDGEESLIYELLDHYIEAATAGDSDDEREGSTLIHSDVGHTVIRNDTGAVLTIYDKKGRSRKGAPA